jgi:hypothetical protein
MECKSKFANTRNFIVPTAKEVLSIYVKKEKLTILIEYYAKDVAEFSSFHASAKEELSPTFGG